MSATARGSSHAAYRVSEADYAVTPATPAFVGLRKGSFKLNLERDTIVSKEITSTRHVKDTVFGARKVIGEIAAELCYGVHDDLFAAALMGAWTPVATKTATTIAAVATGNKLTDSGNGFVTAGFAVGQKVRTTGFTTSANNAVRTITAVAAGELTFAGTDGDSITDEDAGDSVTIRTLADVLKTGSTSQSFTFESHFTDLGSMLRFTGVKIGKLGFKVAANGVVDLTFSLIGCNYDGSEVLDIDDDKITGATYTEAGSTKVMVSSRAVMKETDVVTASVSELSFDLDNQTEAEFVIGQDFTNEPVEGDSNLTGSMTVLFKDTGLLNKWIAMTEDSLSAKFVDAAGNSMQFDIPRVALTGAPPDVSGKGAIPLTVPFQAMLDAATATNITITRTPVA